jgi:dihydroorotase
LIFDKAQLILSLAISAAMSTISVSAPADFHVHLRQGDLSQLVTPHVREGGFRLAYVMVNLVLSEPPYRRPEVLDQPNLTPPITTTDQALEYKATLEKIDPETEFLMTLYLSPNLTPGEVRKAKASGIVGGSVLCNEF